jgi:flagellar basal body rod protein FlgB
MSPHVRRLRIAVQEQERGTRTGNTRMDVDAVDVDIDAIKVGEGSAHYLVSAAA